MDLLASRGVATVEDFPGTTQSSTHEIGLAANQVFSKSVTTSTGWEKRSGGARSFVGLDAPGNSILAVVEGALPYAEMWSVVASDPTDPPGSVRIHAVATDAGAATLVIDGAGRLVSVTTSSSPGSGGGRIVHELTFTEFRIPLGPEVPPG